MDARHLTEQLRTPYFKNDREIGGASDVGFSLLAGILYRSRVRVLITLCDMISPAQVPRCPPAHS